MLWPAADDPLRIGASHDHSPDDARPRRRLRHPLRIAGPEHGPQHDRLRAGPPREQRHRVQQLHHRLRPISPRQRTGLRAARGSAGAARDSRRGRPLRARARGREPGGAAGDAAVGPGRVAGGLGRGDRRLARPSGRRPGTRLGRPAVLGGDGLAGDARCDPRPGRRPGPRRAPPRPARRAPATRRRRFEH